jgi:hypothetical protein
MSDLRETGRIRRADFAAVAGQVWQGRVTMGRPFCTPAQLLCHAAVPTNPSGPRIGIHVDAQFNRLIEGRMRPVGTA